MPRILRFLPLFAALLTSAAQAQLLSGSLPADNSRTAPTAADHRLAARTAALALPFFDDFAIPLEGNPRPQNWLPAGGALVSNRLGIMPLTRGTASLDGLKATGGAYSGNSGTTSYGSTDTLTSQPIDLSGRSAASQLYLSYAWQSGSIIGPPNSYGTGRNVALELQFKDLSNRWVSQWTQRSTGQRTSFRQRAMAVADPRYFHANFQFRFLATGDRTTGRDVWGLDYIYLNANRTAADTTFQDVATTTGLTNPLRRFTAMPWWQFNAALPSPVDELNPVVPTNLTSTSGVVAGIINLDAPSAAPTPIRWDGTVRELTGGSFAGPWLSSGRSQQASPRRDTIRGNPRRLPLPTTAAPKRLRYTLALTTRETSPFTLPNDTLRRDVELNDYYAYDDGTAENFTGISSGATTFEYLALRFDLNEPDQVRGLRVAPVFFGAGSRTVTVVVWENNNGQPGRQLGTASGVLPNPLPAGQVFAEISFLPSIPVSGSFFVGYGQPLQQSSSIGLDLNSTRPDNSYFRTLNGIFHPVPAVSTPGSFFAFEVGAPMFRPVLTHNVTISASRTSESAPGFSLYPNPTSGTVSVAGPAFARATVFDALGRAVWVQPAGQTGQSTLSLPALPAGLYFVRLAFADSRTSTQRLMME